MKNNYSNIPSTIIPTLKTFAKIFFFGGIFVVLTPKVSILYVLTDEFG